MGLALLSVAAVLNGVWIREPSSASHNTLTSVAMVSPTEGWAVGDNGNIIHQMDGTWTAVNRLTNEFLTSVAMVSANEGWAVGNSGTILHYTNGAWTRIKGPNADSLNAVAMVSANEGWAVGNGMYGGTILHYMSPT